VFDHRSYLGWISDVATNPQPAARWPSIALDDALLADYETTFATMRRLDMNEIVIWGLFVDRYWPPTVKTAVDDERAAQVRRLIGLAHAYDVRVLTGLGVYSWGFEQIIAANPDLSRGNPRAMCASNPDAWEWQRRVVDYVLGWPLDGVSMQSADRGRCPCDTCAALGDVAYHAVLNARTADYIRSRRPDALIGVNSWGMAFENPADLPYLVELGGHVDYIIDAHDTARLAGEDYRRHLITQVPCGWGTIGGWSVEPPLHWDRERWFLPCLANVAPHIRWLDADGGTACELFFRIASNPGDEMSLQVAGRLLRDPSGDWRAMLAEAIHETYKPVSAEAAHALADVFTRAEAAYFDNATALNRIGTISMEPLISDHVGEPVYLLQHMDLAGLARYEQELTAVQAVAHGLVSAVADRDRVDRIIRCIDGALRDIALAVARLGEGAIALASRE
jgi:hypothetical protein